MSDCFFDFFAATARPRALAPGPSGKRSKSKDRDMPWNTGKRGTGNFYGLRGALSTASRVQASCAGSSMSLSKVIQPPFSLAAPSRIGP